MSDINGSKPTNFPLDESKLDFKIPRTDAPRENVLKLGSMITNRIGLKATADDPEYWGLAGVMTDEMVDVALKMGVRKPKTTEQLMKLTKMEREPLEKLLTEMAWTGIIEYNWENPQHEKQMLIVYETLANLDVKDKTVITLFNKQDARMDSEPLHDFKADHTLPISAKNGTGLEELKNLLSELLRENKILVERTVPYANAGVIQLVRKSGELLEEEYREDGIYIRAFVPMEIYAKL